MVLIKHLTPLSLLETIAHHEQHAIFRVNCDEGTSLLTYEKIVNAQLERALVERAQQLSPRIELYSRKRIMAPRIANDGSARWRVAFYWRLYKSGIPLAWRGIQPDAFRHELEDVVSCLAVSDVGGSIIESWSRIDHPLYIPFMTTVYVL